MVSVLEVCTVVFSNAYYNALVQLFLFRRVYVTVGLLLLVKDPLPPN